jgi:hypothetical protein
MNPEKYDLKILVRDDMHLIDEQIKEDPWKHAELLIQKAKG